MDERRKEWRRHLYYYSRVFDEQTHELAGRLVDITTGGMMVISEKPAQKDAVYKFKVVLPEPIEGQKSLELEAKSKWSRQTTYQDLYDNGFQIVNISLKNIDTLNRLVSQVGFNIHQH